MFTKKIFSLGLILFSISAMGQTQPKPEFYISFFNCPPNRPVTLYLNKVEIFNNQIGIQSLSDFTDVFVKQDSTGLSIFSGGQSRAMRYIETFTIEISLKIGDQKLDQNINVGLGKYISVMPPCKNNSFDHPQISISQTMHRIIYE
jgi:hypothetical protein